MVDEEGVAYGKWDRTAIVEAFCALWGNCMVTIFPLSHMNVAIEKYIRPEDSYLSGPLASFDAF